MKTSVIVLAYQHEQYIGEALASLAAQTRLPEEVIVIDDCSSDRTVAVIESFLGQDKLRGTRLLRNEANLGVSASMAKAVASASGDIIIAMGGDDISAPGRIERCLAYFDGHPGAMALVTNADVIDRESRVRGMRDNCAGRRETVALGIDGLRPGEYFLRGRSSCGAAAAYRAEIFRGFAPLRPGLYAEDDPAAFRAMLMGTCDFLPERLVLWRRHDNNLSHGTGLRRGPEMAAHFSRCEAMVDQMLADAAWWLQGRDAAVAGVDVVLNGLRFQKSKWALWAAAHHSGIRVIAALRAVRALAAHAPSAKVLVLEAWRPLVRMFVPFFIQRALAGLGRRR